MFRLFQLLAETSFVDVHNRVTKSIYHLFALLATRNLPIFVKAFEDMVILLSDLDFLHQSGSAVEGSHTCIQCFQLLLSELAAAEASNEERKFFP